MIWSRTYKKLEGQAEMEKQPAVLYYGPMGIAGMHVHITQEMCD
jgi:hypothetical protein